MAIMIVNVALPDIRGALSATQDQVAWVVTANIMASAVATPLAGWVAGRFGTRQVMLTAAVIFTIASVLCGTAESLEALVMYRIHQGFCGAPLLPMSQAIMMARFPKNLHHAGLAIWGMGAVLGPIIAPTVGGYLNELYGWRWIFFLIVPFGFAAILAISLIITDRTKNKSIPFDWLGFLSLNFCCLRAALCHVMGVFKLPQALVTFSLIRAYGRHDHNFCVWHVEFCTHGSLSPFTAGITWFSAIGDGVAARRAWRWDT